LVNEKENVFVNISMLTDANSELQCYMAELQDELHFRHRVPYSSGWIASPATRDCLSWHWILWRLLYLKLCWTIILSVWWS